jgi:hypothetical protein
MNDHGYICSSSCHFLFFDSLIHFFAWSSNLRVWNYLLTICYFRNSMWPLAACNAWKGRKNIACINLFRFTWNVWGGIGTWVARPVCIEDSEEMPVIVLVAGRPISWKYSLIDDTTISTLHISGVLLYIHPIFDKSHNTFRRQRIL